MDEKRKKPFLTSNTSQSSNARRCTFLATFAINCFDYSFSVIAMTVIEAYRSDAYNERGPVPIKIHIWMDFDKKGVSDARG